MGLRSFVQTLFKNSVSKEYQNLKGLEDAQNKNLPTIRKNLSYEQEMYFMEVLQRGDINEICQAASSIITKGHCFWASVSEDDEIPLKHNGYEQTVIKTIINIVNELYTKIDISDEFPEEKALWNQINEDQHFTSFLMDVITDILYFGDAVLYCNYHDGKIILSYETGRNVEYVYDLYNQLKEIIILKIYKQNNKEYLLKTFIGADQLYIKHKLYNKDGEEINLGTLEELRDIKDVEILKDNKYIDCSFGTKLYFNKSPKYKNRGASIFSNKLDAIDALDEITSQRQSVLRSGAPHEFVSEDCIMPDASGNVNMTSNSMHKFFKKSNPYGQASNGKDIEVLQSDIRANEYRIYEEDAKRRISEGILSEQSISNSSVINNTTIARNNEKQTNYTVSGIKKSLQEIIPYYVYNAIQIYFLYNGKQSSITPSDIFVNFEEYNNPSLEDQVETCARMKQSGLLPNKEILEEFYGDTKTQEEIEEIATRLDKQEGRYIGKDGQVNKDDEADDGIPAKLQNEKEKTVEDIEEEIKKNKELQNVKNSNSQN